MGHWARPRLSLRRGFLSLAGWAVPGPRDLDGTGLPGGGWIGKKYWAGKERFARALEDGHRTMENSFSLTHPGPLSRPPSVIFKSPAWVSPHLNGLEQGT